MLTSRLLSSYRTVCFGFSLKSRPDLYKLLQLQPKATAKQIQYSYYRLVRKYRPQGVQNPQAHAKLLNQAYIILSNPAQRQKYDEQNGYTSDKKSAQKPKEKIEDVKSHKDQYGRMKQQRNAQMMKQKEKFEAKVLVMIAILAAISTIMLVVGKVFGQKRKTSALELDSSRRELTAQEIKMRQTVIRGEGH